nr:formate acetyltransferase [Clostridiales bacterium]
MKEQWLGFNAGPWQENINVRDFIQLNYTPYEGGAAFLSGPTERTGRLMDKLNYLLELEKQAGGVLNIDTNTMSSLTNYKPGYLDIATEII